MFSAIILKNHSLVKSEQRVSEVLEELKASQTHERAVAEASKFDKGAFEEATRRLESRVSSLEAELGRSREWYAVYSSVQVRHAHYFAALLKRTYVCRYDSEHYHAETKLTKVT